MNFVRNCSLGLAWGSAALSLVPFALLAVLSSTGYDLTRFQVLWAGLTFGFFWGMALMLAGAFDGLERPMEWLDNAFGVLVESAAWLLRKLGW